MNGIRQPHSLTAASGMMVYMTVANALPTSKPMAVEAGTIEQYMPRLSVGAYSAKNVAAHGHGKRPLTTLLVAHVPPKDCADGSQQKRQREHCERLDQRESRVVVREENLRDDDREI